MTEDEIGGIKVPFLGGTMVFYDPSTFQGDRGMVSLPARVVISGTTKYPLKMDMPTLSALVEALRTPEVQAWVTRNAK